MSMLEGKSVLRAGSIHRRGNILLLLQDRLLSAPGGGLQHDVVGHARHVPEVVIELLPHVPGLIEHGIANLVKVLPSVLEEGIIEEEVSHGDGHSGSRHVEAAAEEGNSCFILLSVYDLQSSELSSPC